METTQRYSVLSFPDENFGEHITRFFEAANDQAAIEMVMARNEDGEFSDYIEMGESSSMVVITNITTEEEIYEEQVFREEAY